MMISGIIYWDIPYLKEELEVVGMDRNNNQIAKYSIRSSKQPYALKIVQSDTSISRDKGLAQIIIRVVDQDGVPVMLSDNEITCRIEGPGKLLGLEAGNNSDTDNKHRVFNGRILAYIQSSGEKGDIIVRFTSPWLKPIEVKIESIE